MMQYEGGCHCGNIKFTATGELQTVVACNCSICSMHGSLHWIVAPVHFSLLSDPARMSTYTFHRHIIRHHFCPTCGCATHNEGVTPDGRPIIAINSRCIRDIDPAQLTIKPFDGRSL